MAAAAGVPVVLLRRRRNPVRPVRRDLSVSRGDDLRLAVALREADGIGGTPDVTGARLRLSVLHDERGTDRAGTVLWQGWGAVADAAAGRFDVAVPGAVTAKWCGRYGFVLQLDYDGGAATLLHGALHVLDGPVLQAVSGPAPFVLDVSICDGPNLVG